MSDPDIEFSRQPSESGPDVFGQPKYDVYASVNGQEPTCVSRGTLPDDVATVENRTRQQYAP